MNQVPRQTLKTSLSFLQGYAWPSAFPNYSAEGFLLTGFNNDQETAFDLQEPLHTLIPRLYPELSLSDIAQVSITLAPLWSDDQVKAFLTQYGYKNISKTCQLLSVVPFFPVNFQQWMSEKKIAAKDLSIVNSFDAPDRLAPAMKWISDLGLSKSLGVEALELYGELILMQMPADKIRLPDSKNVAEWIKNLKKLRYPLRSQSDQNLDRKATQINWPKNTKGQWTHRGDQDILNVTIQATSWKEFASKLEQLKSAIPQEGHNDSVF